MANITEQAEWSPTVFLIDTTTPVRGGTPDFDNNGNPTSGFSNAQAKQLADRTAYLKETLDNTDIDVTGLTGRVDTVETSLTAHIGSRGAAHTNATTTEAGFMSATDKTKLNGIAAGAQVNVATDLAQGTRTTTTVPITSSTGTSATLAVATTSLAGVMSSADKTKLDGIATGAQVNAVTSVASKTGAVTLVKGDVGLSNVDNTADSAKPVSTIQQTALDLKAPLASPALTGTPTAPTATLGTNTTQVATTAFVLANTSTATQNLLYVQDQKALNTSGGATVSTNTFQNRDLNTILVNQISGASLASNQITLPAGTYLLEGYSSCYATQSYKTQIYNVTDSTVIADGDSVIIAGLLEISASIGAYFTLPSSKTVALRYTSTSAQGNGLGVGINRGSIEVYSEIKIWKVA